MNRRIPKHSETFGNILTDDILNSSQKSLLCSWISLMFIGCNNLLYKIVKIRHKRFVYFPLVSVVSVVMTVLAVVKKRVGHTKNR